MAITAHQLTLEVAPHPDLVAQDWTDRIAGTLKVSGEFRVDRDLNHGDKLLVVVQTAHGEVISTSEATVGPVTLSPIEDKDLGIVGTERGHKAKLRA